MPAPPPSLRRLLSEEQRLSARAAAALRAPVAVVVGDVVLAVEGAGRYAAARKALQRVARRPTPVTIERALARLCIASYAAGGASAASDG